MKKVCVFTSTRAEYGLLKPLMEKLDLSSDFELQVIASGTHLVKDFGFTVSQIEKSFKVNHKIDMQLSDTRAQTILSSSSILLKELGQTLNELQPDIIVVLGDRYEILPVAFSATILGIPVAHIHGGEVTEGAIDDSIRHAVTKMSHLHFTAADEYQKRVIQLGEQDHRVFNFGALGIENIQTIDLLSKEDLEKSIDFNLGEKSLICTYHPETLSLSEVKDDFEQVLKAFDELGDYQVILTKANADEGGQIINQMIDEYVGVNPKKAIAFISMGQLRYLSALKHVDFVVGNSSSGIIEAPSLKTPTINIGDRQKGRLRALSVFDCSCDKVSILKTQRKIIEKQSSQSVSYTNPYGDGDTSQKILNVLSQTNLSSLLRKSFKNM